MAQGEVVTVEKDSLSADQPLNGGRRAWLVTLGAFGCYFCTLGYMNSFGVFQSYYHQHFLSDYSTSSISWIGSVQVFLLFFGGLFSGPLADRYGIRAVFVPSAVMLIFAIMMTSLSTKYYQILLAQGLLAGLACGLLFTPSISVIGHYFTTNRAWAMGVSATGASIGGVIFPIVLNLMLNRTSLGFGWTMRCIGFIMFAILALATTVLREHAPKRQHRFFLQEAFGSGPYAFTVLGFFFCVLGFYAPLFYIADYSRSRNIDAQLAFYTVAIMNGASFFGRTLPSFTADKIGPLNTNIFMAIVTAVIIYCWTTAKSTTGICFFIAAFGFAQGALVALINPCLAQVSPNPSDIGTYIGMAYAVASFGGLADSPINGALIDKYGYLSASVLSATLVLLGAGCYLTAKLLTRARLLHKI